MRSIITPVIKKNQPHQDLSSYRPISNMSFLSKFIERVVSSRIDRFILSRNLFPSFQSVYRPFHLTETVLLHLCNEIAVSRNKGLITCVVMRDFSAAFHSVDHEIRIQRLSYSYNFSGVVL